MRAPGRPTLVQRLRVRAARLTWALTRRRPGPEASFAELRRIESDAAYRALFVARLDAAITDRDAEREAVLHAIEAAGERLRCLVGRDDGERPA
ncbi:hypothetical protein PV390_23325 [Streptomyces sp. ME02-6991-2A]|uniref:hypothetical protein n=1 Tax=Streptomyces TaxID=1883 RepID=UPI00211AF5C9|nr:hypothetical protein [Streptomyces sp. ME02-6991-2A]MDX3377333.1 hypothetical protein [Streptomyces sp. ME02-6991-2A]